MKNNYDDIILKYLSDLLDEKERYDFESELGKNSGLKERFEAVSKNLEDVKQLSVRDSDTGYFAGLVPKVRERMDAGPRRIITGNVQKALGMGLTVFLVMFLILQNGKGTSDFNFESFTITLESADNEELNEFVELRYSDLEHYDIISEIDLENYSNAVNEQLAINDEAMDDYAGYSYFGLDGIDDISESEEDEIYSSLIDKKIL